MGGGGCGEFSDLLTNVSDRFLDVNGGVSIDLLIGDGETLSFSLSNMSDRIIGLVIGIFSINGGAGLSICLSNVPDRGMDIEKGSVLVGM